MPLIAWVAGGDVVTQQGLKIVYGAGSRVPREEQMMLEQFGEQYRAYMERTGRIFPKRSP